jgi:hypothetical protein
LHSMSFRVITTPFPPAPSRPRKSGSPRFEVPWQRGASRRMWENLGSLIGGPRAPKDFDGGRYFRGCWIKGQVPRRSIFVSVLWHSLLIVLLIQFGRILWTPPHVAAMPDFQLTWSSPAEDLPLLSPKGPEKKVSPPGDPAKPVPKLGADGFHPRQTIINAPKLPTHPRQTLIQPDMPPEAPKILPPLPNMVIWQVKEPARPKLQLSAEDFAKMHPNRPVQQQNRDVAVPEILRRQRILRPTSATLAAISVSSRFRRCPHPWRLRRKCPRAIFHRASRFLQMAPSRECRAARRMALQEMAERTVTRQAPVEMAPLPAVEMELRPESASPAAIRIIPRA